MKLCMLLDVSCAAAPGAWWAEMEELLAAEAGLQHASNLPYQSAASCTQLVRHQYLCDMLHIVITVTYTLCAQTHNVLLEYYTQPCHQFWTYNLMYFKAYIW